MLQHTEVLGHRRPADRQFASKRADRHRARSQTLEDRSPGWVSQRGQGF